MTEKILRAITFLAPNQYPLHEFVMQALGRKLGCEITLQVGEHYEQVYDFDLSFICGLPYILRTPRIEAIAAAVLIGERYQNRPVYFSDVIVHRESDYQCFADLRGCTWAYNEPESQSGYGITRYHLANMDETSGFFGKVVNAGFHQKAIRMVCRRKIDAAAIDCHVLALEMRDHPRLNGHLKIIDRLGPSSIQPIAVRADMPESIKTAIQDALTTLHTNADTHKRLQEDFVDRFAAVTDSDYDDIREMLAFCKQKNFTVLR